MSINNLSQMPAQLTSTLIGENVAANLSTQIKEASDEKTFKKIDADHAADELLESQTAAESADTGRAILRNLVSRAMGEGIIQDSSKINDEKQKDSGDVEEKSIDKKDEDQISISSFGLKKQQKNIITRINLPESLVREFKGKMPEEVAQYAAAYEEYILDDKSKKPKKLEKLEMLLKEKGLTNEQIHNINKEIRNIARADMAEKIKESYTFRELSDSKLEKMMHGAVFDDLAEKVFYDEKLSRAESGRANDDTVHQIQGAVKERADEIEDFVREETESRVIGKMLNSKEVSEKDLGEILTLSQKKMKNFDEWLNTIWMKKKEDLGFNLIQVPERQHGNIVDTTGDNSKNQNQERRRDADEKESTEDKILVRQLKAIYVEQLLKGRKLFDLSLGFKIKKLKNGLIKLGIFSRDLDEKLNFEAETSAKETIMDDLRNLMLEKASLFESKGSASEILEKKKESLLESAKRVGMEISNEDLKAMQDNASRGILDMVKRQIELYEGLLSKRKDKALENELKKFKKLESRLMGETSDKIVEDDEESEDLTSEIA